MLKGLRRAFSKGHSTEVEALEADKPKGNGAILVKARASHTGTQFAEGNPDANRSVSSPSNAGLLATATCGKTAWSFQDLAGSATPPLSPHSSKPLSPSQSYAPVSLPSVSSVPAPPSPAAPAWGEADSLPRPTPEKGASKSKLSGLFRSASKSTRSSTTADSGTAVEAIGSFALQPSTRRHPSDAMQCGSDDDDVDMNPKPSGGSRATVSMYEGSARGAALRGVTLQPTHLELPERRRGAVIS